MSFVDRNTERTELEDLAKRPGPSLAILYGRRRIGKTYLLQQLWSDNSVFYYLASDTTSAFNRKEFVQELAGRDERSGALDPEDFGSWRGVFRELFRGGDESPFVVVLDEFQYLMGGEDDIRSQFVAVWDTLETDRSILVVLCGSAVRTMRELDDAQAPLYGRIDWKHMLEPFDYWNAGQMAPLEAPVDRARIYGALGGTPDYLAALSPDEDLRENVARTALSPRGHVRHVVESVIEQERGLQNIAAYRSILIAIARGRTEVSEIADLTELEVGTPLRRKIQKLEDLGFVEGRRNFDASTTAPYRYRLRDPALRFNFGVVESLRNELETSPPLEIWDELVGPRLRTHMGFVFESMVHQAYLRLREARNLPTVSKWGYWEGLDRNRNNIEFDVVARLSDKRMMTGEVKWNRKPIGADVFNHHRRNLQRLADSGRGWAAEALEDSADFLFVAAGGFDDSFETLASTADQNIRCWTLDDLYSDAASGAGNVGGVSDSS